MKLRSSQKKVKKAATKALAVKEPRQSDSTARNRSGRRSTDLTLFSRSTSGIGANVSLGDPAMGHEKEKGMLRDAKKRKAAVQAPLCNPKKRHVQELLTSPGGSDQEDVELKEVDVIDFSDLPGETCENILPQEDLLSSVPLLALHHFNSGEVTSHKRFMGVFLCLDTQGFTEFVHSGGHQPMQLAEDVNNFFQKIIEKICKYNGDIVKFTGDGFQVVWRYYTNLTNSIANEDSAMGLAMLNALYCAIDMTKEKYLDKIVVRAGLSIGEMLGMITHYQYGLGKSRTLSAEQKVRKEYFVLGETIEEGNNCEKEYKNLCEKQGPLTGVVTTMDFEAIFNSLYPDITMSGESFMNNEDKEYYFCTNVTPIVERRYVKSVEQDKRDRCTPLIEKYLRPFTHELVRDGENNQHTPSFSVCVFICLHMDESPAKSVTANAYDCDGFIERSKTQDKKDYNLHVVFTICFASISKSLRENRGMLRQFIHDDKGIVAICTFDDDKKNTAARNAAKASQSIQYKMYESSIRGTMRYRGISISTSIGMSLGNPQSMWFGLLGSRNMRQEYMVLGCPVLIAARLMALKGRPLNEIRCHNFPDSLKKCVDDAFSHEPDQEADLKVFGKIKYQLLQLKA